MSEEHARGTRWADSSNQVDFTKWIRSDPEKKFEVTPKKITWTHVDRTNPIQVYNDFPLNYFKDFEHTFIAQITGIHNSAPTRRHMITLWKIWNPGGNVLSVYAAQVKNSNDRWNIVFFQRKNGKNVWVYSSSYQYAINKKYFFKVQRKGKTSRIIVYEDDERTVRIEDSEFREGVADYYRTLSAPAGINVVVEAEDWSSGSIENLRMTELIPRDLQPKHEREEKIKKLDDKVRSIKKKLKKDTFNHLIIYAVFIGVVIAVNILIDSNASLPLFVGGLMLFVSTWPTPKTTLEKTIINIYDSIEPLKLSETDPKKRSLAHKKFKKVVNKLNLSREDIAPWYSEANDVTDAFINNLQALVTPAILEGMIRYEQLIEIPLVYMSSEINDIALLNEEYNDKFGNISFISHEPEIPIGDRIKSIITFIYSNTIIKLMLSISGGYLTALFLSYIHTIRTGNEIPPGDILTSAAAYTVVFLTAAFFTKEKNFSIRVTTRENKKGPVASPS